MNQSKAPPLDALADYHQQDRYGFSPPGHRQGRGTDERVLAVLGRDPFRADVLASGGLDDFRSSAKYLSQAEELMADAVGASTTFFSTCGSCLSVRAAMMAVAGGSEGGLLVPRDSHKSIVGGLIFSGIQPRWIVPRWDTDRHLSHPPSPVRRRSVHRRPPGPCDRSVAQSCRILRPATGNRLALARGTAAGKRHVAADRVFRAH
jgi:arginine decarboxylase